MKIIVGLSLLVALAGKVNAQESTPVTVIELFTSQGCSSCPAADDLLNQLVDQKGNNVIGLSFHVSYWNYLGWKDPYSSEQFTERQRTYASIKKLNSIYTPQMIVDGREEFVGSDRRTLAKSLESSKGRKVIYAIKATATIDNSFIKVNYSVEKNPSNEVINIALVEKYDENYVPRGENQGLTLKHYNVVRKFETQPLEQSGSISITLPSNFDSNKSFVVLYAQDKALKTLGAVQVNL